MASISFFLSSSLLPLKPHSPPFKTPFPKLPPPLKTLPKPHLSSLPILFSSILSSPFPSLASELLPLSAPVPSKISLEAILVSIDDFLTTHPFFVYGVAFIWLIAIPVIQSELSKCKFVSAVDAFLMLRDDPSAQLLDIRDERSLRSLGSPNLRILGKETLKVRFVEGEEDGFVEKVLERVEMPKETVVCVLDNFDGNSMQAAELLYKNGFKGAYAIEGGVLGEQGWKEVQEKYFPPSAHIFNNKKKKSKKSEQLEANGAYQLTEDQVNASSPVTSSEAKVAGSDTNYYADIEQPSSPSPSKP